MKKSTVFCTLIALSSSLVSVHIVAGSNAETQKVDLKLLNYRKLNAEAVKEYQQPIRPGGVSTTPFWNGFSKKFLYAPAFDFKKIDHAEKYLFTVRQGSRSWSFKANSPTADLSPVWAALPVGTTEVVVHGLDHHGKTLGEAGRRRFFRDFPFHGPYPDATRSYREAALKAAYFVHRMAPIQYWKTHNEPDMSYDKNAYACKILGATIRLECFIAREIPVLKNEALTIAHSVADCLIRISQPEGAPLAAFPPTYYKAPLDTTCYPYQVVRRNKGKTMFLEAVAPAEGYLDLYDLTGEKRYFEQAVRIADTYLRTQAADGSWPIKVDYATGKPVNNVGCLPAPLLSFLGRLKQQYGIDKYDAAIRKSEAWVLNGTIKTFDMTGQFEDQPVEDLKPYQNLTNCTARDYAVYLLNKEKPTPDEISTATELARFSEDQFAHWEEQPDEKGFLAELTPCVHEQYFYETPVDGSAGGVSDLFLLLYKHTGKTLYLAKAKALIDAITRSQNIVNGQIPTTWEFNAVQWNKERTFWINCTFECVYVLMKMSALSE